MLRCLGGTSLDGTSFMATRLERGGAVLQGPSSVDALGACGDGGPVLLGLVAWVSGCHGGKGESHQLGEEHLQ